jgi:hypothetical protein
MAAGEVLTEREQQGLEHMRKAQELGATLKEYAARFGLDVQMLYQLRKPLVRKGALGPGRSARQTRREKGSSCMTTFPHAPGML